MEGEILKVATERRLMTFSLAAGLRADYTVTEIVAGYAGIPSVCSEKIVTLNFCTQQDLQE